MKAIKGLAKVFTSGELIAILDTDGDGKVSWSEVKNAPFSVWLEIIMKYAPYIYLYISQS